VLRLLADGWNNKAIAARPALTEGTVKNYVLTNLTTDQLRAIIPATNVRRPSHLLVDGDNPAIAS
jgi:hypothetical protein